MSLRAAGCVLCQGGNPTPRFGVATSRVFPGPQRRLAPRHRPARSLNEDTARGDADGRSLDPQVNSVRLGRWVLGHRYGAGATGVAGGRALNLRCDQQRQHLRRHRRSVEARERPDREPQDQGDLLGRDHRAAQQHSDRRAWAGADAGAERCPLAYGVRPQHDGQHGSRRHRPHVRQRRCRS
jgi:hypothetical protein